MPTTSRRIVVTGASRGLGLALGQAFTALGHQVEGCSRSGLPEAAAGFPVAAVDVRDHAGVHGWAERLAAGGHVPDLLVANAGLINEPAPLWKVPPEEVEAIIATNVMGPIRAMQAFLPAMVARGGGLVVVMSSGWGRMTDPDFAPYCSSKYAVEGLVLSLSKELPKGLAAVSLSPGVVQTDMCVRCWGDRALEYEGPDAWAARAAPFVLSIGPGQNGAQLTTPPPPQAAPAQPGV